MKDLRIGAIMVLIAAAIGATYVTPNAERTKISTFTYPALACSGLSAEGTTTALLANAKVPVRVIAANSLKYRPSGSTNYPLKDKPLLIDSNPTTSLLLSSSTNHWVGVTSCLAGSGDQWFVGGSGEVTSKSRLDLVNSGLSAASVEISIFTAHQNVSLTTIAVNANSSRAVSLDALAPGESSVVIHVVSRSGRVSAFLFDERTKGLSSLGMDYVNSAANQSTDVYIPAILGSAGKGRSVSHFLRLLVPGNLDANIKVTVLSDEGNYTPLGFDDRSVTHSRVIDIPLSSITESKPWGLHIHSDQPIVAGVRSQLSGNGSVDYAWASAASDLESTTLNLGGLAPTLVFTGSRFSVRVAWLSTSGSSGNQTINGDQTLTWQSQKPMRRITLTPLTRAVKAAAIIFNTSAANYGLSYFPIVSTATVESVSQPVMDATVISRG